MLNGVMVNEPFTSGGLMCTKEVIFVRGLDAANFIAEKE